MSGQSFKLWQGKVSKTTRSLAGETGANRALLNRLFTRNKPASWGNTSPFGLYRLSCLWLFREAPTLFYSFRSLHSGLFMPENFVFGLSRTPSYHLVMRNTYRFWKETRFKFFNFKILQVVFCLFNYGQFRNRFIFYTALVPAKVLPIFRQSGSFHMSLTITNFFQQWDFLCDCLLSANRKNPFSHKITNRFRDIFSNFVKKHSVAIPTDFETIPP